MIIICKHRMGACRQLLINNASIGQTFETTDSLTVFETYSDYLKGDK